MGQTFLFIAHAEASLLEEPRESSFNSVTISESGQLAPRFGLALRNDRLDAPVAQRLTDLSLGFGSPITTFSDTLLQQMAQ
jgi:hypothetical protein